jgi:hypothetical protein
VVKCLPNKQEALSLHPSTFKKKKQTNKNRETFFFFIFPSSYKDGYDTVLEVKGSILIII